MKLTAGSMGKHVLSKLLPNSSLIRFLSYLPKLESWRKKHAVDCPMFKDRYDLYSYINSKILNNQGIIYLEFGVFKGDSIKFWSKTNTHDESSFWGFDTFSGLPSDWNQVLGKLDKSTFNRNGDVPNCSDKRVSFIRGLFQETLPNFLQNEKIDKQIVIHNDSDLYSATLYTLTQCDGIIEPGTIIIFDEFSTILDEYRALEDYCQSYLREYDVLGVTKSMKHYYNQVAIRIR